MTLLRLILRSLFFYRRTGIVIAAGLAIAVAAITGSLLVGRSVSGSLRDTARQRLGSIDHTLLSTVYFPDDLAARVQHGAEVLRRKETKDFLDEPKTAVVALLQTTGVAANADSGATIPNVRAYGIDDQFPTLFPGAPALHLSGREAAINQALAADLRVAVGDALLLHVDQTNARVAESLFTHRRREETLRTVRLTVSAILPDQGMGGFALENAGTAPRNLFLPRAWLQTALKQPGKANVLLVDYRTPWNEYYREEWVRHSLSDAATLADSGLKWRADPARRYLALEGDGLTVPSAVVHAAAGAARDSAINFSLTSVYLADRLAIGTRQTSYALVACARPATPFRFKSGGKRPLPKDGIWLNSWAATDLQAKVGDKLTLTYLAPQRDGRYRAAKLALTVAGIVRIDGPADDPLLTPDVDGITTAENITDWETPFPLDLRRVTARDDDYWTRYRTTPKAFVSMSTIRAMWQSAYPRGVKGDWVTALRYDLPPKADPKKAERRLTARLKDKLGRWPINMRMIATSELVAASAKMSTDFGELFLYMSFFIVLAAAGLAAMLMRLLVRRRATEAGLLLACGFDAATVGRALLGEGFVLTVAGVVAGVPLGILYAWGIMRALTTWWIGAVGTPALWLHLDGIGPLAGIVGGFVIGHLAIHGSARQLTREPALRLLSGWQAMAVAPAVVAKWPTRVMIVSAGAALLLGLAAALRWIPPTGAFFSIGAALLVTGLCLIHLALSAAPARALTLPQLAWRSAAANRGRSLLVVGLLAAAAFIIVTVAANARDYSRLDVHQQSSGTGGFALRAVATLPLRIDFSTPAGRRNLGFSSQDERLFAGVKVYPCLLSDGDDVSCLNLNRPRMPRVLAVSKALMDRGGFTVLTKERADKPWARLADYDLPVKGNDTRAAIPAFGDADSVMWTLHSNLGSTLPLGDTGAVVRFAGLLPGSIFGSEILVAESHFRGLFPDVTAPRYFLLDVPKGQEDVVADALRRNLGDMGLEVRGTREVLNAFIGVQNTYLSTFLALGGLGLLLGTLGLVAVLLRNALERRKEFALLLAVGFPPDTPARLLLHEHRLLLTAGLLLGTVAALVAVLPQLLSTAARVNWPALLAVLAALFLTGLLSTTLAARAATRGTLLEGLRGE